YYKTGNDAADSQHSPVTTARGTLKRWRQRPVTCDLYLLQCAEHRAVRKGGDKNIITVKEQVDDHTHRQISRLPYHHRKEKAHDEGITHLIKVHVEKGKHERRQNHRHVFILNTSENVSPEQNLFRHSRKYGKDQHGLQQI